MICLDPFSPSPAPTMSVAPSMSHEPTTSFAPTTYKRVFDCDFDTVTPIGVPTPSPSVIASCTDTDSGATDPYGDGCADYAIYTSWCGGYDDDDFTSCDMCCACSAACSGGGASFSDVT